jgi:hypothetical protein
MREIAAKNRFELFYFAQHLRADFPQGLNWNIREWRTPAEEQPDELRVLHSGNDVVLSGPIATANLKSNSGPI